MKELKSKIRKFLPKIREAKERGLNEADTRMRVRLLLSEVLGYDLLNEITQEHIVQGHYVDMTVKTKLWDSKLKKYEHKVIFFIEVKSVDTTLRKTHMFQAINYAATAGIDLVLLTNLIDYQLYHITWDKSGVEPFMVMSFNILDDEIDYVASQIQLLRADSFKKGTIHKFLKEATTLSDQNFLTALLSPRVLSAIRSSLKDITGHRVKDDSAIIQNIRHMIDDDNLYDKARAIVPKIWKKTSKPAKAKKAEPSVVAEKLIEESTGTIQKERDAGPGAKDNIA